MALTAGKLIYGTAGAAAASVNGAASDGAAITFSSAALKVADIYDTNGNAALVFTATASAVNYLTLANAATGNNPILAPVGSDTNIAFTLRGKGTGALRAEANLEFYDSGGTTRLGRFYKGAGGTMYAELSVVDFAGGTSWGSSSSLRINPFTPYLGGSSNFTFGWAASTDATAALDTGLRRNAAGVVEVNNGTSATFRDLKLRQLVTDATITAGGTTGAQTINKGAGTVNFAASATSLVVTNSLVTANSLVICYVLTNDATMMAAFAVCASGSFTIRGNAAPTAETKVGFVIVG